MSTVSSPDSSLNNNSGFCNFCKENRIARKNSKNIDWSTFLFLICSMIVTKEGSQVVLVHCSQICTANLYSHSTVQNIKASGVSILRKQVAFLETKDENNNISNEAKLFLPSPKVLQNIDHCKMQIINKWFSYNTRIIM